jgi:hypothetical protein
MDYAAKDLHKLMKHAANRALEKGKQKAREAYGTHIAQALIDGAGPAHKITAIDHALPPLRLVIEERTKDGKQYTTDPIKVATTHTEPFAKTWGAYYKGYPSRC